MLAYDYPLLGVFWTFMFWFLWIAWILLLFRVISDIFRSRDLGGVGKAFWALFVIVLPWLGVCRVRVSGHTDDVGDAGEWTGGCCQAERGRGARRTAGPSRR